jgi:hypothetical protein
MLTCANCGATVPSGSRFCPQCGAPQRGAAIPSWSFCEIAWWRGFVRSEFYVRSLDGSEAPPWRSHGFRWRRQERPPETEETLAARDEVIAKLVADGWEPIGAGNAWYAHRFRRRLGPVAHVRDQDQTEDLPA